MLFSFKKYLIILYNFFIKFLFKDLINIMCLNGMICFWIVNFNSGFFDKLIGNDVGFYCYWFNLL